MIVKRNFNILKVIQSIWIEITTSLVVSLWVMFLFNEAMLSWSIPFSIIAIVGSSLAIFIAFRNQSSYARWWEARTIWGNIVANSRVFARQICTNVDHAVFTNKITQDLAISFKKEMVFRHIAFVHSLRLLLRNLPISNELKEFLSENEIEELTSKENIPNYLLTKQGTRIKDATREEHLGAFDTISMEPNLASFSNLQSASERIKNTPLPMNYQYFTSMFLFVFIIITPFSIVGEMFKLQISFVSVPLCLMLTFIYSIMNKVGKLNENPFDNQVTDIPLTAICNEIERDLKEMIDLPKPTKTQPINGYLS